jgi:flavin reductase (DIM6/NTAB) family NADH-FMN oxidoreductase RutF
MLLHDEFRPTDLIRHALRSGFPAFNTLPPIASALRYQSMNNTSPAAMVSIDPSQHQQRQIYKLMTGIIVPRPIALVSTVDENGSANLAPFSFFAGVGSAPPTVLFCPALRPEGTGPAGQRKDTLRNVEATREFVINVVSEAIADQANATSAEVSPEIDEFQLSSLTPIPSQVVKPPRVAESPAQMECKLLQVIYTGNQPASGVVVLGEVLRFHIRHNLFDDFRIDPAGLDGVGRMAGNTWVRTRDRIELIRPK